MVHYIVESTKTCGCKIIKVTKIKCLVSNNFKFYFLTSVMSVVGLFDGQRSLNKIFFII